MTQYLIDSDVLIHFFKRRFNLGQKFSAIGRANCFVSEITIAELFYGASYSTQIDKHLAEARMVQEEFPVLPITMALEIYGSQKARLRKAGNLIDSNDIFIASTAIAHDLIMVTGNTRHFERFEGIVLEDWTSAEYNEFII